MVNSLTARGYSGNRACDAAADPRPPDRRSANCVRRCSVLAARAAAAGRVSRDIPAPFEACLSGLQSSGFLLIGGVEDSMPRWAVPESAEIVGVGGKVLMRRSGRTALAADVVPLLG